MQGNFGHGAIAVKLVSLEVFAPLAGGCEPTLYSNAHHDRGGPVRLNAHHDRGGPDRLKAHHDRGGPDRLTHTTTEVAPNDRQLPLRMWVIKTTADLGWDFLKSSLHHELRSTIVKQELLASLRHENDCGAHRQGSSKWTSHVICLTGGGPLCEKNTRKIN